MATNNKANNKPKTILWSCSWCGAREMRGANFGRPHPGKCPRKNGDRPHTWVKQHEFR